MTLFDLSGKINFGARFLYLDANLEKKVLTSQSNIFFILEGDAILSFADYEPKEITEGQMLFLPPGIECNFLAKRNIQILILEIADLAAVCYHFLPTDIIPSIPLNESLFHTLDLKIQLYRWLVNMKDYLQDGRFDNALISIKTFELFCLLKHCYSMDDLGKFFAPAMQEEYKFALFILSNYSSVKTAEELAHLSNYSFSAFEKQFRKVFETAPYRWMLQRKIQKVYREIYETSIPLKVIADEFGFSSLSQLSDFCRKHFDMSPIAIRNKRKNNPEL